MNEEKLKDLLKLAWDAGSEECLDTYYGRETETFQEWYTKQKLNIHSVMQGQQVLMWLGQWRDKLPIEAVHALQDIVSCPTVGKAGGDASVSDGK